MLAYAHTLKHPPLVARTHPTATSLSYNQPVKHAAGVLSSPQETIWRNSLKIKREREKSSNQIPRTSFGSTAREKLQASHQSR